MRISVKPLHGREYYVNVPARPWSAEPWCDPLVHRTSRAAQGKPMVRRRLGATFQSTSAVPGRRNDNDITATTERKRVKLYSYFRSSAAYRVRIALNLKGVAYETVPIHLTRDGGRQNSVEYRAINPQMRVPALVLDSGEVLVQSLAIISYIDEVFRDPPLLPADPVARARSRGIAEIVACDIHPINNLVTLNYLRASLGHDQADIDAWYAHWIVSGFAAIEAMIEPGPYALGANVGIADLAIVPQVFNARRYKLALDAFPKILAVEAACLKLPAFDRARPENQPDAE